MTLTVEVPDVVLHTINLSPSAAQAEVLKELAVVLYARGLISTGKAAELCGTPRFEFEEILALRRVERPYDLAELERDLVWAEKTRS